MTIDTGVASRLQGRSLAWRLGASATAAIFVVLVAWALSVDFVKASSGGFFGDGATYYSLAHSLSDDLDFSGGQSAFAVLQLSSRRDVTQHVDRELGDAAKTRPLDELR